MTEPHDTHGAGEHAHAGHGTTKQYLAVCAALMILTFVSFFTFRLLHNTQVQMTWAVMMAVSCVKALLVMLFFMHLKWEASWKYVLTIPATIMAIFLMIALIPDIKWRFETIAGGRTPSEERKVHMGYEHEPGTPAETEQGGGH
ncbi:MAG: cytochrome C oxidase subunit IV family protein [Planctomycetia bacterium]|nr:cytochrome C oxidase subunit IV family protein [Planctomycetia bacterium]